MASPARDLVAAGILLSTSLLAVPVVAAPGDTCADAIEIATLPFTSSASSCGAGNEFTNDAGGSAICTDLPRPYAGDDRFHRLTLAQGNRVAFELSMPPGASGDLALFLVRQSGCGDVPVCAGNSVDLIGAGVGPERIKSLPQSYPTGTYYLVVDSVAAPPASCGPYTLEVTGHLSEFCGNGIVDGAEVCDDGNNLGGDCCAADCSGKAAMGTLCRDRVGACDQIEVCDGNGNCPVDQVLPRNTPCRLSAGVCDVVETCSGIDGQCPADRFDTGTICRGEAGPCDRAEVCSGAAAACPPDEFRPSTVICSQATFCMLASHCAGAAACPLQQPRRCDDGNPCTQDLCHPNMGCFYVPMCVDAGADASPDASEASAPDGPTDGRVTVDQAVRESALDPDVGGSRDTPLADVDPMLVPPDGASRDLLAGEVGGDAMSPLDQALADGPADRLTPVSDASFLDSRAGQQTLTDSGADPIDAGRGDGGATDGGVPGGAVKNVAGGCGCRIAGSNRGVAGPWLAAVVILAVSWLRRRKRPN